ncbi:MAG: hypothetical protein GY870_12810 [archaeon]|nr:hypothetical protein [archaeon]
MKTLLFGPQNAGKTSLMRTTCLGYSFVKVTNLKPTKGISRESFIFRGLLDLSVWDAGGQERYMEKYFSDAQKPIVFADIDVAIFMAEATINSLNERTREVFDDFVEAVLEYSPKTKKIHVLFNKVDLEDSKEDKLFDLLTDGLEPSIHKLCAFTPVSVKSGSAQHRLIEVLDTSLQNSIMEMQKMSKIRSILEKIKEDVQYDVIVFNRPDGLIISSTLGKFETEPLKFMTLELGSLESNIHSVFSKIMTVSNKKVTPIELSILLYESEENFVVVKDIEENTVMVLISHDKKQESLLKVITLLSGEDEILELKKQLRFRNY